MPAAWVKQSSDLFLPQYLQRGLQTYIVGDARSDFYIQGWSIFHFVAGVVLSILFPNMSLLVAFLVHFAWETWQLLIGSTPRTVRGAVDATVDTLVFLIGFSVVKVGQHRC